MLEGAYCAGAHAHHQVLEVERRSVLERDLVSGRLDPVNDAANEATAELGDDGLEVPLLDRLMGERLLDRQRLVGEVGVGETSVSSVRSPARSARASSASSPAIPPPRITVRRASATIRSLDAARWRCLLSGHRSGLGRLLGSQVLRGAETPSAALRASIPAPPASVPSAAAKWPPRTASRSSSTRTSASIAPAANQNENGNRARFPRRGGRRQPLRSAAARSSPPPPRNWREREKPAAAIGIATLVPSGMFWTAIAAITNRLSPAVSDA